MTLDLFEQQEITPLFFEEQAASRGYKSIAGVDEVGRGPLAGPVVAAAVILPPAFDLPGLTDSKKLTEKRREELFPLIMEQARAVGIGLAQAAEIDETNILKATLQSMVRAIGRLSEPPDFLLVDGITSVPLTTPQMTLKKGDSRSLSIAAASVVAKVVRDRIMIGYDRVYPGYGFAGHKGYGSAKHMAAIAEIGVCPLHRRSFGGVREHVEQS